MYSDSVYSNKKVFSEYNESIGVNLPRKMGGPSVQAPDLQLVEENIAKIDDNGLVHTKPHSLSLM